MAKPDVSHLPYESSFVPEILTEDHRIKFACHPGVSCFNACCKQADVMLAPYDVLRLKQHLKMTSDEFLKQYTVPWEIDGDGIVGVKLKTNEDKHCLLMNDKGCSVYNDRPSACRYYPFGLMGVKHSEATTDEQNYFRIEEEHCKGHEKENFLPETKEITLGEYRKTQGVEEFDKYNLDWIRLMLKKKSAGPSVGAPSTESLQVLFMATYDLDRFKRFIQSTNFQAVYDLDSKTFEEIQNDDIALLKFGYRFLRQVLFGEKTIELKNDAVTKRAEERKEYWKARHDAEMEYANLNDPRYDPKVMGDEVMGDNKLAEKAEAAKKEQEK
ncbi:MAG: YkgJ family cysteine cluster protein [gamma proteobacterium symbiont of Lucinoma myriamae]|nr:YkgJ family cysteine cluster protein [gamma proteobacterium symbiont of Lucinoma myriamae]MCU7817433.1 YkgJ family cysteine cluster protein [gamma proteobacterium symbiont of Lucinoma myriamae]MCU7833180.1 YkgJ family cysteine cluster protein [gamma proteobacterium symbiont of Lucinoma myriamae]